jgi:FkbM family methyltransferase
MGLKLFIKNKVYGKKRFQSFFQKLYTVSLGGMNYGNFDFSVNGEHYFLRQVHKWLRKKSNIVLFDVGANAGQYSDGINRIFGKNASVHAFEPSPTSFANMKKQVYDCVNMTINPFGLSDIERNTVLYCNTLGGTGSTIFEIEKKHGIFGWEHTEEIELSTLDKYCAKHKIEQIDFLKIDTEGNEYQVLEGGQELLEKKRISIIQFEFGDKMVFSKKSFRDFYELLKGNDFRIFRLLQDGLIEVKKYSANDEIYTGINYVAILNEFKFKDK